MDNMWNEASTSAISTSQQVPMTGLQAKRKRDHEDEGLQCSKLGPRRVWPEPARSSPRELWPPDPDDSPPESDEEDEELEELSKSPYRGAYPCYPSGDSKPYYNGDQCDSSATSYGANYRPAADQTYCPPPRFPSRTNPPQYWPSYCYPSEPQTPSTPNQTIRCAENGKSYLELGSSPLPTTSTVKCSRTANYRQQRLTVLNISMFKLSRFRQFPDPSLYRSVLICNTLRRIEREMEQDSQFFCNEPAPQPINYPSAPSYPATPPPPEVPHYEHSLRDVVSPAPRATPFPSPAHPGSETPDSTGSINWGSVLSLSSQSDLDPLNNNGASGSSSLLLDDLDSEIMPSWRLGPLNVDDVLKSVPVETPRGDELVDSLMHVLVGS